MGWPGDAVKIAAASDQKPMVLGEIDQFKAELPAVGRIIYLYAIQTMGDHFLHQSGNNPYIRTEYARMGQDCNASSRMYHGDCLVRAIAETWSLSRFMPAKILIECLVKIIHHTTLDQETGEMGPASLAMARHSQ